MNFPWELAWSILVGIITVAINAGMAWGWSKASFAAVRRELDGHAATVKREMDQRLASNLIQVEGVDRRIDARITEFKQDIVRELTTLQNRQHEMVNALARVTAAVENITPNGWSGHDRRGDGHVL